MQFFMNAIFKRNHENHECDYEWQSIAIPGNEWQKSMD